MGSYTVEAWESLGSTNDRAMEVAHLDKWAVLAVRQTAGRGRYGRKWDSMPGNLHVSIVARSGGPIVLPFKLAAAVIVVLENIFAGSRTVQYKWPNDVLIDGRKACGILPEMAQNGSLVLGLGLNIGDSPQGFSHVGNKLGVVELLRRILEVFDAEFIELREFLDRRLFGKGEMMQLRAGDEGAAGLMIGMSEDFEIVLRCQDGVKKFGFGEATLG